MMGATQPHLAQVLTDVSPNEDLSWEVKTLLNSMFFGCNVVILYKTNVVRKKRHDEATY